MLMLAGQVMVGRVASVTVTVKEQDAVLPLPSVARHVLVVTPSGYVAPLARPPVWVTELTEQLSVAVGVE